MNHHVTILPCAPIHASWDTLDHPQRIAAVRALVSTGTAKDAATALATTKSAIIGFCSRNSIPLGDWIVGEKRAPEIEPQVDESNWLPSGHEVSLLDRTDDQCCWPTSGQGRTQMFCGRPKSRGAYCRAHAAKGYAPRLGDTEFVEVLRLGRMLAGKEPEVSLDEALALVRGKQKEEAGQ